MASGHAGQMGGVHRGEVGQGIALEIGPEDRARRDRGDAEHLRPLRFINEKNEWIGFSIDLLEAIRARLEKKLRKPIKLENHGRTSGTGAWVRRWTVFVEADGRAHVRTKCYELRTHRTGLWRGVLICLLMGESLITRIAWQPECAHMVTAPWTIPFSTSEDEMTRLQR
jgi:hypothetical protein